MDAMVMAYKVRPTTLSDGLQKGDTIAFGVDGET
jgi:Cu/Ag efflux protein CusF